MLGYQESTAVGIRFACRDVREMLEYRRHIYNRLLNIYDTMKQLFDNINNWFYFACAYALQ